MAVRREIAELRRETGARSPESPMRTGAVRGGSEGRARWPEACRNGRSAMQQKRSRIMRARLGNVNRMNVRGPDPCFLPWPFLSRPWFKLHYQLTVIRQAPLFFVWHIFNCAGVSTNLRL